MEALKFGILQLFRRGYTNKEGNFIKSATALKRTNDQKQKFEDLKAEMESKKTLEGIDEAAFDDTDEEKSQNITRTFERSF